MTRVLLATDSVHTTAAACDYLGGRLETDDVVTVLTVEEDDADPRDAGDALNVAAVRLGALATVEMETRAGEATAVVLDVLASGQFDEVVVGIRGGRPSAAADVGSTARGILLGADLPVVVVPVERLE